MTLERPQMRHYREVMRADRDYKRAKERPYCGMKGRIGYTTWLTMVRRQADESAIDQGYNCNQIYFMLNEKGTICGFGQLRPVNTNDVLTWAGHIGYSVPPSLRGMGYATLLLQLMLKEAFSHDLRNVLLTCDVDNAASRRVIEKCRGKFVGYYKENGYNKCHFLFTKEGFENGKNSVN